MDPKKITYLEWSDDFSSGIHAVDDDHRKLVALLNGLLQSIVDREDFGSIREKSQHLIDISTEDFLEEEKILRQMDYPGLVHHSGEHEEIKNALSNILGEAGNSTLYVLIEAALDIREQLVNHFLDEDAEIRHFIKSRS